MRGVKGCFVCGRDLRANSRHSREELTAAINKLKSRHPSALITVEDLSSVMAMAIDDAENAESENEDDAFWNEEDDDSDEPELAYMATIDQKAVETMLADNAFTHGYHYRTQPILPT